MLIFSVINPDFAPPFTLEADEEDFNLFAPEEYIKNFFKAKKIPKMSEKYSLHRAIHWEVF